jgi:hypothetical protein
MSEVEIVIAVFCVLIVATVTWMFFSPPPMR